MRRTYYAFPSPAEYDGNGRHVHEGDPGMLYVEWLAGMALQGIMANPAFGRLPESNEEWQREIDRRTYLAVEMAHATRQSLLENLP